MSRPLLTLAISLLFLPSAHGAGRNARWPAEVQAVLDAHCVKCHGPLEQKGGLELDTLEGVLKGDEVGPVIKPGNPDESPLITALAPGSDPHMPPKKQLPADAITKLRDWVAALEGTDTAAATGQVGLGAAEGRTAASVPADPSAAIDHFLEAGWQARAISPTPSSDDRTFLRRVFLDLAGRLPTRAEVDSFLFDGTPEKRGKLVDRILASDEYARTFREVWDALLMGRGAGRREQRRRDNGWFAFLERAFKENRPWNKVVHAIIAARPELPEDKGAQWFLFERRNDHQRVAEAIAPVIYGTRVDCAQCHDHALAREIKQGHYWGLVAAFNRSKNVEKGAPAVAESAVGGFINFTNLRKESQPAVIAMLTGRRIEESMPPEGSKQDDSPDGYIDHAAPVKIPKFSRRGALADAATTDNPLLAKAFVNHTWAILMGRGIVHPVDEINSKNPPSHPELLEWLAEDFATHGYDVRRLVRSIVMSRAYHLARQHGGSSPAPEAFAAGAEKPLIAETIARSLRVASGREPEEEALRRVCADTFPEVLPRTPIATIQQAMLLANSPQITSLFKPEAGNAAEQLASIASPEARVREAFRMALIRDPDPEELARGVEFLKSRPDHPGEAAGELLWALVTGPEFLTNH
jgi:hypothetical protein